MFLSNEKIHLVYWSLEVPKSFIKSRYSTWSLIFLAMEPQLYTKFCLWGFTLSIYLFFPNNHSQQLTQIKNLIIRWSHLSFCMQSVVETILRIHSNLNTLTNTEANSLTEWYPIIVILSVTGLNLCLCVCGLGWVRPCFLVRQGPMRQSLLGPCQLPWSSYLTHVATLELVAMCVFFLYFFYFFPLSSPSNLLSWNIFR